jgi:hypothetical protein
MQTLGGWPYGLANAGGVCPWEGGRGTTREWKCREKVCQKWKEVERESSSSFFGSGIMDRIWTPSLRREVASSASGGRQRRRVTSVYRASEEKVKNAIEVSVPERSGMEKEIYTNTGTWREAALGNTEDQRIYTVREPQHSKMMSG